MHRLSLEYRSIEFRSKGPFQFSKHVAVFRIH